MSPIQVRKSERRWSHPANGTEPSGKPSKGHIYSVLASSSISSFDEKAISNLNSILDIRFGAGSKKLYRKPRLISTIACLATYRGGLGLQNPTWTPGYSDPAFLASCFTCATSADRLSSSFWHELFAAWALCAQHLTCPWIFWPISRLSLVLMDTRNNSDGGTDNLILLSKALGRKRSSATAQT